MSRVYQIPKVAEIAAADAKWWNENFAADGLHPTGSS
jgi:hypothetical protein